MRQLTSLDAEFLAMEGPTMYGHVSGLAIYEAGRTGRAVSPESIR